MAPVRRLAALIALALCAAAPARAAEDLAQAQQAELDRVRGEVADEIQLSAYDLVDELVYGWLAAPVFDKPTPVVLGGVTVPVGLGTGMAALLENHLADVLGQNPTTQLQLVYCPACTAVVVHSGPEATVLSRGIDDPAVLAELGGDAGRYALFIDVEAEGTWLVLRARLTQLTPDLPIVWSCTLASSASTPALLRQPNDLKSAADARQEYLDALRGRGPLAVPVRFAVRTYAHNDSGIAPPPFIWLQSGVELGTTPSAVWTGNLLVGYSLIPNAYQGLMAQARVQRLMGGRVRSLTRPNLYGFVGGAILSVWGPAPAAFQEDTLTTDDLLTALAGEDPRYSFGAFQFGLDLRIGGRVGMSAFLETLPSLWYSDNMGAYLQVSELRFQSLGSEVTFWF